MMVGANLRLCVVFFRNNMISIFLLGSVRVMRKSTLVLQGSNLPEDIYVS